MFNLGTKEIIIIAVVIVLLFGGKKIPELTKSIIDSMKQLKNAFTSEDSDKKKSNKK